MCNRMSCRGPDGERVWVNPDGRVALGHRRLAIIDLSESGAQPMSSAAGAHVISFNGEIYNYRELRAGLERNGVVFRSSSDTEVLLHLYAEQGAEMVQALRGMYAFALWDTTKSQLLLARDQFGIKPLYYADDGEAVRVASEVKALLTTPAVDTHPDAAGHAGFFLWGHVPEPRTLYRGVRSVPAGSTLVIDSSGIRDCRSHGSLPQMLADAESSSVSANEAEATAELRIALLDSVRHHLIADVDVGIFLSAGLDSCTLLALAAECNTNIRTVTLGFEEFRGTPNDEVPYAEAIARRYGADHRTVWITRRDFEKELDHLLDRMDQPSIDGVNSYFVSKGAAESGLKVALSGLGGDELFAGYPSFREIPRLVSVAGKVPYAASAGAALRLIATPLLRNFTSPKYASTLELGGKFGGAYLLRRGLFLPWELSSVLNPDFVREGLGELQVHNELERTVDGVRNARLKVSALEASWYMRNQLLRDTDWASMSHSLEVRVPFVDWALWKRVIPLILGSTHLGKRAMALTPRRKLPDQLLSRKKTGFFTPTRQWIQETRGQASAARGLRGWAQYVYSRAA